MTFHQARADLICHILNKGPQYLTQIKKGNGYDKLIRNYHQFNAQGEKVYRTKKAQDHLVFSKDAWRQKDKKSILYYEHSIPIKRVKNELDKLLINAPDISPQEVEKILNKSCLVVITKKEQARIDNAEFGLKDEMPKDWDGEDSYARFKHSSVMIELAEHTLENNGL